MLQSIDADMYLRHERRLRKVERVLRDLSRILKANYIEIPELAETLGEEDDEETAKEVERLERDGAAKKFTKKEDYLKSDEEIARDLEREERESRTRTLRKPFKREEEGGFFFEMVMCTIEDFDAWNGGPPTPVKHGYFQESAMTSSAASSATRQPLRGKDSAKKKAEEVSGPDNDVQVVLDTDVECDAENTSKHGRNFGDLLHGKKERVGVKRGREGMFLDEAVKWWKDNKGDTPLSKSGGKSARGKNKTNDHQMQLDFAPTSNGGRKGAWLVNSDSEDDFRLPYGDLLKRTKKENVVDVEKDEDELAPLPPPIVYELERGESPPALVKKRKRGEGVEEMKKDVVEVDELETPVKDEPIPKRHRPLSPVKKKPDSKIPPFRQGPKKKDGFSDSVLSGSDTEAEEEVATRRNKKNVIEDDDFESDQSVKQKKDGVARRPSGKEREEFEEAIKNGKLGTTLPSSSSSSKKPTAPTSTQKTGKETSTQPHIHYEEIFKSISPSFHFLPGPRLSKLRDSTKRWLRHHVGALEMTEEEGDDWDMEDDVPMMVPLDKLKLFKEWAKREPKDGRPSAMFTNIQSRLNKAVSASREAPSSRPASTIDLLEGIDISRISIDPDLLTPLPTATPTSLPFSHTQDGVPSSPSAANRPILNSVLGMASRNLSLLPRPPPQPTTPSLIDVTSAPTSPTPNLLAAEIIQADVGTHRRSDSLTGVIPPPTPLKTVDVVLGNERMVMTEAEVTARMARLMRFEQTFPQVAKAFQAMQRKMEQLESVIKLSTPLVNGVNTKQDLEAYAGFMRDLKAKADSSTDEVKKLTRTVSELKEVQQLESTTKAELFASLQAKIQEQDEQIQALKAAKSAMAPLVIESASITPMDLSDVSGDLLTGDDAYLIPLTPDATTAPPIPPPETPRSSTPVRPSTQLNHLTKATRPCPSFRLDPSNGAEVTGAEAALLEQIETCKLLRTDLVLLEDAKVVLEKRVRDLVERVAELETGEEVQNVEARAAALEDALGIVKVELKEREGRVRELEGAVEEGKVKLREVEGARDEAQKKLNQLELNVDALRKQITELEERIRVYGEASDSYKQDLQHRESRIEELEAIVASTRIEVSANEGLVASIKKDLLQRESRIKELESMIASTQEEGSSKDILIATLQKTNQEQTEKINTLIASIDGAAASHAEQSTKMESELQSHIKACQTLRTDLDNLEKINTDLNAQVKTLLGQIETFETTTAALTSQVTSLQAMTSTQNEEIQTLKTAAGDSNVEKIQAELHAQLEACDTLRGEVAALEEAKVLLENQVKELTESNGAFVAAKTAFENQVKELTESNNAFAAAKLVFEKQVKELTDSNNALKAASGGGGGGGGKKKNKKGGSMSDSVEIAKLRTEVVGLEEVKLGLEKQVRELVEKVEELKRGGDEGVKVREQAGAFEELKKGLERQVQELTEEIREIKDVEKVNVELLERRVGELEEAKSGIEKEKQELRDESVALQAEIAAKTEEIDALKAMEHVYAGDVEKASKMEAELREQIEGLKASLAQLDGEKALLEQSVQELKVASAEAEPQIEGLKASLAQLEEEKALLEQSVQELKAASAGFVKEVALLNAKIQEKDQEIQTLKSAESLVDSDTVEYESKIQQLEATIQENQKTLDTLRQQIFDYESRIQVFEASDASINQQLQASQTQIQDLESASQIHITNIQDLQTSLTGNQAKVEELEALLSVERAKIQELEVTADMLRKEVSDYESRTHSSEEGYALIKQELHQRDERIHELEATLTTTRKQLSEEEEKKNKIGGDVKNSGWENAQIGLELSEVRAAALQGVKEREMQMAALTRQVEDMGMRMRKMKEEMDGEVEKRVAAVNDVLKEENERLMEENERMKGDVGGFDGVVKGLKEGIEVWRGGLGSWRREMRSGELDGMKMRCSELERIVYESEQSAGMVNGETEGLRREVERLRRDGVERGRELRKREEELREVVRKRDEGVEEVERLMREVVVVKGEKEGLVGKVQALEVKIEEGMRMMEEAENRYAELEETLKKAVTDKLREVDTREKALEDLRRKSENSPALWVSEPLNPPPPHSQLDPPSSDPNDVSAAHQKPSNGPSRRTSSSSLGSSPSQTSPVVPASVPPRDVCFFGVGLLRRRMRWMKRIWSI
ncbi:hypothetical protein BC829DRAFT_492802 [Chytridium lagenaria]|nr:hypothetical protein BC829DRAFT_492802 [Chytridium lagenaria]